MNAIPIVSQWSEEQLLGSYMNCLKLLEKEPQSKIAEERLTQIALEWANRNEGLPRLEPFKTKES